MPCSPTSAPGQNHREGITILELFEMFPDEETATAWFESVYWPEGRCCGHCGAMNTRKTPKGKPMPYWCPDCRSYFSVRTGTALACSRVPLRKWAIAVYLFVTNLKGISSMKLHRELGVTQKTAWYMMHRLREAWQVGDLEALHGPVEIDETYVGGLRKNMSKWKRKQLKYTGTGGAHKTAVVGMKDRATNQVQAAVVDYPNQSTIRVMLDENVAEEAQVYTDGSRLYSRINHRREYVRHDRGEYVRGDVHTNGIESFWAMLKRAHKGTFHKMSPKHLHRYVTEFAGRHNIRQKDTVDQMESVVAGLVGVRLMYNNLTNSG